jgi:SAM-dependent methyltransferase
MSESSVDHLEVWRAEEAAPFAGWDFSSLEGRWEAESPPWPFETLAIGHIARPGRVLDLGTGGGEWLSGLEIELTKGSAATEEVASCLPLARDRLAPLGVGVVRAVSDLVAPLPFANDVFRTVHARHAAYHAAEVARVLQPDGVLISQQVGGDSLADLQAVFGAEPAWPFWTLEYGETALRDAGFLVDAAREWSGDLVFRDVGAIVYYLRAVPWMVEGFTVDGHRDTLLGLQARLDAGDELRFRETRYLFRARMPGNLPT